MKEKCSCGCETRTSCDCNCLSYGKGKHGITACIESLGGDVVLRIGGGQKPHAGCVVICEPDEASGNATTPVHTFTTHREEAVARPIAESLCRKTGSRVVCVCGIHVENAGKKDIALLVKNAKELGKRILNAFD